MFVVAPIAGAAPVSHDTSPLPSVSAKFDHTPTIVFPDTAAPTMLAVKVLQRGTGPRIAAGDLVVANYHGQIWRDKVFDSSFTQPIPFAFLIGVGKVIRGWDKTLVGQDIGSRVLVVVPPVDAYGAKGLPKAGITGKDTLVFVIDLLGAYGPKVCGDLHPVPVRKGIGGVHVSGLPPKPPKITIARGAPRPTGVTAVVLDRGHGAKVRPGLLVVQAVTMHWDGKILESTWSEEAVPDEAVTGMAAAPTVLDKLVGTPLGSRVLVLSASPGEHGPFVFVVDFVAQPPGTPAQQ
jgi:peptidylprolyl isomerase